MLVYGTIHAFILTMEMFTMHVVLGSSMEGVYSFLFYNNFNEIKIYVFKNVTPKTLFEYATVDAVERFQIIIYLINIMFTTSLDTSRALTFSLTVILVEIITDWLKHFITTRNSNLNTNLYNEFRVRILRQYKCLLAEEKMEMPDYLARYKWELQSDTLDTESIMAINTNFLIFPQCILILRNV